MSKVQMHTSHLPKKPPGRLHPFTDNEDFEPLAEDLPVPEDPPELPYRAPASNHTRFRRFTAAQQLPVEKAIHKDMLVTKTPRPAWMHDTSHLPKKPPGR